MGVIVSNGASFENEIAKNQYLFLVLALCAVSASTMLVEIVIVKFIGSKVYPHFISMIISTVVLSFAAAGTFLYMKGSGNGPSQDSEKTWQSAAREAAIYSITLMLTVIVFCWLPIDPYKMNLSGILRVASLPIYFTLFICPFFFGGLCISRVLVESSLRPSRVLLFDLTAAAIAAATAPMLLELVGGYGAIGLAAALGLIAAFCFEKASGKFHNRSVGTWSAGFMVALAALLAYPGWAYKTYGIDVRGSKSENFKDTVMKDFHGFNASYWNAIARIDVSNTGISNDPSFVFGLLPHIEKREGRLVALDRGANTRQFVCKGNLSDQKFLGEVIPAVPYVLRPDAKDALIIGGGGGIDILIAKYHGVPRVDAVEINPMTCKHVLLGEEDSESALYQPWLRSDDKTKVTIINKEARSYCSTVPPNTYDTLQATGVDTFTAIASGALACSDNYLYTYDGIQSYMHLLKPDGVLSLTYARKPVALPIKLFLSYLNYLEGNGISSPWRNIVVVATDHCDVVMKKSPFTEAELQRLRQWCVRTGATLIFDPERRPVQNAASGDAGGAREGGAAGGTRTGAAARANERAVEGTPAGAAGETRTGAAAETGGETGSARAPIVAGNAPTESNPEAAGLLPEERIFSELGFEDRSQRQKVIDSYKHNIVPATDDKPYFYQFERTENWLFSSPFSYPPISGIILIGVFALILIALPLRKVKVKDFSLRLLTHALSFAMCGFAFLFFEVAIIQMFSIFVGGPIYALAVVLVSVLAGYSIGCFIVGKLPVRPSTFIGIGSALFLANILAFFLLPPAINSLFSLSAPARIAICAIITLCMSTLAGLPVPLAMEAAKRSLRYETAWFWGISCAFNALGAACFPIISMQLGVRATLAMVAVLYLVANFLFTTLCSRDDGC